jgi:hypothetical protein
MTRVHRLSLPSLLVALVTVPLVWTACGGGKPPETPADESSKEAGDGSAPAASNESPSTEASAASNEKTEPAPAASEDSKSSAAASPPPAPALGDSDCGKCIEKACTKQAAACGKSTDCQATIDSFHGCSSDKGAAACLDAASLPSGAKPKKLATAYEACAKKAATSKACKTTCK